MQTASAEATVPVELSAATAEAATLSAADVSATTSTTPGTTTEPTTSSSTTTESTSTTTLPNTTSTTQTPTTQTSTTQVTNANTSTTTKTITTLDIEVAAQQVTTAELGVTSAQTQIESAKLALQQAKDTAAARQVTAPIDGTVTTLNIGDGDTLGSTSSASSSASGSGASTSASSSSSALVITDLSSFEATVTLAEADIASVKVGQKATMTFDALPDLTLTGKVESVDSAGTVSQGVVSYTVTIVPDVANDSVKGGMTVTADIITSVTSDALVVPSTAVKSDSSGGNYVQILTDGSPVSQTVVVGTSNDSYTQITSGLTEGQKVVTATINPSAGSTATTAKSNGSSLLNSGGATFDNGGGSPPSGAPPAGN